MSKSPLSWKWTKNYAVTKMKKFPYSLIITKVIFNIGPYILRTIRRATHKETKECINIRLGRMLELKNQTAIDFHKKSSWKLSF